uniref:Uncharacterized protein n=1 Tax=Romanomermis culicivorax TaxID=13658 RepID=A0A915IEC1_ROMCU
MAPIDKGNCYKDLIKLGVVVDSSRRTSNKYTMEKAPKLMKFPRKLQVFVVVRFSIKYPSSDH